MSPLIFSCPHCAQHLQCNALASGCEIQCPNCDHLIRIPPAPGQTAQYQPESGKTWNTFVPTVDEPAKSPLRIARSLKRQPRQPV
jgi:hypothetical protein